MNFSCNGTEIDIQYLNDNCKLSKGSKGALEELETVLTKYMMQKKRQFKQ